MLRYNADTQYKTFTGGIISIGIFITILFSFASMIISTINRTTITYSLETEKISDPTSFIFSTKNDQSFMLAFEIISLDYTNNIDLNSDTRYFDQLLKLQLYSGGQFINETDI
jgi:hypothetical protein